MRRSNEALEVADGLPRSLRRQAMITLSLATAMSVLDVSIANIALPTIARELRAFLPPPSGW